MPNHYSTILLGSIRYSEATDEPLFDVDKFNDRGEENKHINLCNEVIPMPAGIADTTVGTDGFDADDELGWLGWAQKHWGTKWGTYEEKAALIGGDGSPVMIEFQSAWGPPSCLDKIIAWFEARGLENVVAVGHEPYDNTFKLLHGLSE